MLESQVSNPDIYGLFRAAHSHNPTQYSHIVGLSSHFYAHIGVDCKVFPPTYEKAHVGEILCNPDIIHFKA